tara:strand:+ start:340 stop:702 length:363 start_codon:yes stop_codon:yes gene_type:complete
MPEIVVNINDQDYAIVCDPGEENHLKNLSSRIDNKVRDLTKRFGKIGETRLMVMASLLISDEIHELNKKIQNDLSKITSLEKIIADNEKNLVLNKENEKTFIDSKNKQLNDLLSQLTSLS